MSTPSPTAVRPLRESDEELCERWRENFERLRRERKLTLETLAERSGVDVKTLRRFSLALQWPSLDIVPAIARALGTTSAALFAEPRAQTVILRRETARWVRTRDASVASRPLRPQERTTAVQTYELTLQPGALVRSEPHPPGTLVNLVVVAGALDIEWESQLQQLELGDAVHFLSDSPHAFLNRVSVEARLYLVAQFLPHSHQHAYPLY